MLSDFLIECIFCTNASNMLKIKEHIKQRIKKQKKETK